MLGASFDHPEDNRAFADAQEFPFRLLSDVDRRVAELYGATREPGDPYADYARRVAFLIDPDGVIARIYDVSDVAGHAAEVLADVEAAREVR